MQKNTNSSRTFRLFSELPSFLSGYSSLFDLTSIIDKYNTDKTDELADERSVHSDWNAVGSDMYIAINKAHEARRRKQLANI